MRQENNINTLKLQNYKTPKLQNSNIADSCGSTAGAASWTRRESLASSGNLKDGPARTRALGRFVSRLFKRLGLWLHPNKADFTGAQRLDILGIEVDTERQLFLLGEEKWASWKGPLDV